MARPAEPDPTLEEIAERAAEIKAENMARDGHDDERLPTNAVALRPSSLTEKPSNVCKVRRKAIQDAEDDDEEPAGLIADDPRWQEVLGPGDTTPRRLRLVEELRRRVRGR